MQYFMISLNISYKVYEKSEQIMVNNNISNTLVNNKNTEKINIKNDSKLPVKPAKVNYQKVQAYFYIPVVVRAAPMC